MPWKQDKFLGQEFCFDVNIQQVHAYRTPLTNPILLNEDDAPRIFDTNKNGQSDEILYITLRPMSYT